MDSLEDALTDGTPPWRAIGGAIAVIAGLVVAGIGTLSVALDAARPVLESSAVVPVAATATAVTLSGTLAATAALLGRTDRQRLAVGVVLLIAGVFAGSLIGPAGVLPLIPAAVAAVAGLLLLILEVLAAAVTADVDTAPVPSLDLRSDSGVRGPTYADGGDDDDRLHFPLDDEE